MGYLQWGVYKMSDNTSARIFSPRLPPPRTPFPSPAFPLQFLHSPITIPHQFQRHQPRDKMNRHKDSISRLLPAASISRFGKENGKESLATSPPIQLPRRRTSTVRVPSSEDSTGSEQHSATSCSPTSASASAKLLRMTSMAGFRSLDTSSNSSIRSTSNSPKLPGSPVRPKNSFRLKAPNPLRLDENTTAVYLEQPLSSQETATPSYKEQFRRRRGDLLHRLGPSVPYMQAYDPTSLQWWVIRLVNMLSGLLTFK